MRWGEALGCLITSACRKASLLAPAERLRWFVVTTTHWSTPPLRTLRSTNDFISLWEWKLIKHFHQRLNPLLIHKKKKREKSHLSRQEGNWSFTLVSSAAEIHRIIYWQWNVIVSDTFFKHSNWWNSSPQWYLQWLQEIKETTNLTPSLPWL